MDDELLKIYSLMKTAEDQLAALKQATGALTAERTALAKDRAALEKTLTEQASALKATAANLKTVGASLREEAQQVTPALQKAVREAVAASMRETLTQASNTAAKALETASEPILGRLAGNHPGHQRGRSLAQARRPVVCLEMGRHCSGRSRGRAAHHVSGAENYRMVSSERPHHAATDLVAGYRATAGRHRPTPGNG
jgi:septal ring factor EnvC (AmiA/AmiB activator)